MATVLNKLTKQLIQSANTIDYLNDDWIVNPDMSAVVGYPAKYWVITGDDASPETFTITLMDQAARDAVDAAEAQARKDATAAVMDQVDAYDRAFAQVVLDEMNLHAARITAILNAIDGAASLADVKTAVAAINDVPQRTIAQLKSALLGKLGS